MIDSFLGRAMVSPPQLPSPDKILKWDSRVMGYRPVLNIKDVHECEEVLFAFVFKKNPEKKDEER